ncbi:MAG: Hsp20/alpha crystallin family protein [Candidatus Hydrogenedentes bacterium]|nr:Hsp20/alpha crystallin family protein [Candidatus Hydrogenedentota bacterium]
MTQDVKVMEPEAVVAERPAVERGVTVRTPAMDIVERHDDVVLALDLPGVAEDGLEVNVENGVLTIAGQSVSAPATGLEEVHREHAAVTYRRVVRLSDRLNAAGISAQLRQGVLRLVVPKREETKARRVPIAAG